MTATLPATAAAATPQEVPADAAAPMTERPTVLLCVDEFKSGGVTIVMMDLARVLRDRYDVRLAATRPGPWLDRVTALGLPVDVVDRLGMVRLMRAADIVHSHSRGIGLLAVLAGRGRRSIEHVHNFFTDQRLVSFRGRTVIAVSKAVRAAIERGYPHVDPARLHVVRNAVPSALLAAAAPRTRPSTLHLVSVGRLSEQKDPLAFLALADELRRREPGFHATWVGEGPLAAAFVERRRVLGLEQTVTWEEAPPRERAMALVAEAGVLAITSRWEGFPLVALEAMAVGTPIATTDSGDMTEEIEREDTGTILRGDPDEPGTVAAWADAVQALWRAERWAAVSARANLVARTLYTESVLAEEIAAVYEEVLGHVPAAASDTVQVGPFRVFAGGPDGVVARIAALAGRRSTVFALHVGGLNHRGDPEFVEAMNRGDLVHADGNAVVLVARAAGAPRISRASTTDIGLPAIRAIGEQLGRTPRVALIGGRPETATQAGRIIEQATGAELVFTTHGFHADYGDVLRELGETLPDVVVVGMGMPLEAVWVMSHLDELPEAVIITCGGWFGFLAGAEHRAPALLRRVGLEWTYRVAQAPLRLGPRYLRGSRTTARLAGGALIRRGRHRRR